MPDPDVRRRVDPAGHVWFDSNDASELLLRGYDITALLFEPDEALTCYNTWCERLDKPAYKVHTSVQGDPSADGLHTWWIDPPYDSMPVREALVLRCSTDVQRQRVHSEMDLFEARGLLPVLRLMIMLVAHFRAHQVVWGVGRGSSVASYVLYLIGIHRIDAVRYGLDINEFLRELPDK